jgi:hypothetical protein
VNSNLVFAGTEFGVFASVDAGGSWTQLKGNLPPVQVRDMAVQRRENDLVLGTFGRGFWILDDYSALREMTPQSLAAEAELYPTRNAYSFNPQGEQQASEPTWVAANPPVGAYLTYSVGQSLPADTKLVITITDDNGRQVRRLDVSKDPGVRRVVWNLRADPGAPVAGPGGGGRGGRGGGAGAGGAGGAGGGGAGAGRVDVPAPPPQGGGGGRGGPGGPLVEPGHYTATLGKMVGDQVTPVGKSQPFHVLALPPKNY